MNTATAENRIMPDNWQPLCAVADLVAHSGIAACLNTPEGLVQIAIFYLPGHTPALYAIDHHDPFSGANVIARGIVGDIDGQPVVASPLYKQHFQLRDGLCREDNTVQLRTWQVALDGDVVMINA